MGWFARDKRVCRERDLHRVVRTGLARFPVDKMGRAVVRVGKVTGGERLDTTQAEVAEGGDDNVVVPAARLREQ